MSGVFRVERNGIAFHVVANIVFESRHVGVVGCAGNVVDDLGAVCFSNVANETALVAGQPGAVCYAAGGLGYR